MPLCGLFSRHLNVPHTTTYCRDFIHDIGYRSNRRAIASICSYDIGLITTDPRTISGKLHLADVACPMLKVDDSCSIAILLRWLYRKRKTGPIEGATGGIVVQ